MNNNNYFNNDHLRQNLKTRAIRGAGATIFAQSSNYAIQTVGTIVLARLLTPDDFGLITMVATFSLLLQNFGVNGFTEAIIQEDKIDHQKISNLFWINISASLILTLLFIASSPLIAGFYKEPRLKFITIAMAFSIIFSGTSTQHSALLKRNMQFYSTSIIEISSAFLSTLIAIILAFHGWGYWSLVARRLLSPLTANIGSWIVCRWRPGLPSKRSNVMTMVKFALHTYGTFCTTYLRRNLDKILIGRVHGSEPLGFYDRAYHFSSILPNQLTVPLTNVSIATLSRLADNPKKYSQYLSTILSTLAFISLPLSAILTLTGKDFICLLLGPQWDKAGYIFSALGPGVAMIVLYDTHGWLHISFGRADRWLRWGIISFIATAICFFIGLFFGPLGVAIAHSASYYILICPAMWYAGKAGGIKLSLFISAVWKYFVAAIIAGLLSWMVLHVLPGSSVYFVQLNIFIRIITATCLCLVLYLVFIVALFRSIDPILQFIDVLREMKPRFH